MLGGLRACQGDTVITRFKTHKTGALLAHLAFHSQRTHTREALIELLWPESDLEQGRPSLSVALSSLRHQLEPPGTPARSVLLTTNNEVRLNPAACTTDVAEFEALLQAANQPDAGAEEITLRTQAVALYRGELLPGFYEDWCSLERERLQSLYIQALRRLVRRLVRERAISQALTYAERAVSTDPLQEELHRDLMQLYAAAGQPSLALRQYREVEERWREELGARPSAAIRHLAQEIAARMQQTPETTASLPPRTESPASSTSAPPTMAPAGMQTFSAAQAVAEDRAGLCSLAEREQASRVYRPALPMQFTRFFGREKEIAHIRERLTSQPQARLVTLTGPGGTGKTRLAIEAASLLAENWRGAVWFVSLASVQEAGGITATVLEALKLPRSGGMEPVAQLRESLGRQPALLVLDNLEQIAEGAAPILVEWLEQIPSLSCLATSRQRLNIAAEHELVVQPLPTPTGQPTPERLVRYESVRLFVDRAQAVNPDFQVTVHNAAAIAELCNRLEGLPLALELAAARARALTPTQMLAQLQDRFAFLTSRRRDLPERHHTLRATIDWSYRLLDARMQRFFASLFIFQGGWTLEATRDICAEAEALDALCQLQECSLIVADARPEETEIRFRMLQMLQAFGAEQLTPTERAALQERHAAYFARFAGEAEAHLTEARQTEWLRRLERERENLRATLVYLLDSGRVNEAAPMCAALSEFWERHGWLSEAVEFLERCLTAEPSLQDPILLRRLLGSAGWFAYLQGRYREAQGWQERSLAECLQAQDREGECIARNNLGLIAQAHGQIETAWQYFEQSLEIARQQQDTERQAARLSNLGLLAIQQERHAEARTYLDEALTIFRVGKNTYGVAACLCNIAKLAIYRAEYIEAQALANKSLQLFQDAGDRSGMAYALANLGLAQTLYGARESAARDLRHALEICQEIGLYSLAPVLLEAWARNDAARSRSATAVFALAAAERLRKELNTPRNAFEEQTVAGLQEQFDRVRSRAEIQKEQVTAHSLPLDQVLAWMLDLASGDPE
jgi:predicted ATPase/DNA-binding SARP family transcriptional activator